MTRWLLALALCAALPASAGVFKCKKTDGGFIYQEKPCDGDTKSVGTLNTGGGGVEMDSNDPRDAHAAFYIDQAANGHYFVDGRVNDRTISFMIDTGATAVSLPGDIANSADIHCERTITMLTANGVASACKATINKLTFGRFILRNVDAVISPNLSHPLLGMNVLNRFNVEQHDGQMVLSRPN